MSMPRSLLSLVAVPRFLQPQLETLERHLRDVRTFVPLQFELGTHEARVITQCDGVYHIQYGRRSGPRHYVAQVDLHPGDVAATRATLTLGERGGAQTVELAGEAVFDPARVPTAFRPAHERLVACLRQAQAQAADASAAEPAQSGPGGQVAGRFVRADAPSVPDTDVDTAGAANVEPSDAAAASTKGVDTFEPVSLERHNEPVLQFRGRLLARVTSPLVNARRYVLSVYETPGGNQVAVREGLSMVPFECPRTEAKKLPADATERLAALQAFFGFNATARALYRALGAEPVETID
jgi:hypothetical protein